MKASNFAITAGLLACVVLSSAHTASADLTEGMKTGKPGLKSAGSLAFGPEGILFVADPKGAAVYAIDTGDKDPPKLQGVLKVQDLDNKIAALLGTTADEILIEDLAVNPSTGDAYFSVSRGKGPEAAPAIVRVGLGTGPSLFDLAAVKYSKLELGDAPEDAVTGEGRRRRNKRMESITDLAYVNGQVAIAGLSNEEFASTLRTAKFPFEGGASASSIEIYHGAHGRQETSSPIRTFLPMVIGGEPNIVASYTCTPLVTIPLKDLKPRALIKGKTVAELGNRNRPLDMIEYQKDGKTFILIANSARGIMKVSTEKIAQIDAIKDRVEGGKSAGLSYETVEAWQGVTQLAKRGSRHAVIILKDDDGLHLEQLELP